jgi:hypothetical protein
VIPATGADFYQWNVLLTRRAARLPTAEIIAKLRGAAARTTIPRFQIRPGADRHRPARLDIRPLGLPRRLHEERLRVAFRHLADRPSPGYAIDACLSACAWSPPTPGWTHGAVATVRGPAETPRPGDGWPSARGVRAGR